MFRFNCTVECNVTYGSDCTVGLPILMPVVKLINPAVLLDKKKNYVLFSSTVLLDKQLVAPCSAPCTIR